MSDDRGQMVKDGVKKGAKVASKVIKRRQYMKKTVFFGLLVMVLAFSLIGCKEDEDVVDRRPPEQKTEEERWGGYG